jgi:hypothetical protein
MPDPLQDQPRQAAAHHIARLVANWTPAVIHR